MKSLVKLSFFFACLFVISCNPQKQISGYYTYETECLGTELDGSETLKAWGSGKNRKDAVEQAKKNAVRDILFKGIRKGKPECAVKPLIVEVNAQEKYQDYFYDFFADKGPYTSFVSNEDNSLFNDRHPAGTEVVYGIIVRVLRNDLKKQLISDKIIKQ